MSFKAAVSLLLVGLAASGCSPSEDSSGCPSPTPCTSVDGGSGGFDASIDAPLDCPDASPCPDACVPPDADPPTLRIMTFNIKHAELSSLGEIAEVIRAEDPDLVGLQEVDVDADRSGNVDQAHRLSQLTGMASLFRSALTFAGGGYYGVALLSRFPIITSSKLELTSGSEQRIVALVDVLTDVGTLVVAVTHLGLTAAERDQQVDEILAELSGTPHVILMGDMNAEPSSPEMQKLGAELDDVWVAAGVGPGYTIPVDTPDRRIDYIFLGADWPEAQQAHVPSTNASDHLPVVATVPWP